MVVVVITLVRADDGSGIRLSVHCGIRAPFVPSNCRSSCRKAWHSTGQARCHLGLMQATCELMRTANGDQRYQLAHESIHSVQSHALLITESKIPAWSGVSSLRRSKGSRGFKPVLESSATLLLPLADDAVAAARLAPGRESGMKQAPTQAAMVAGGTMFDVAASHVRDGIARAPVAQPQAGCLTFICIACWVDWVWVW